MIQRKPELVKWQNGQPGGLTNPLGARALYIYQNGQDTGYRIHGSPEWWSIGQAMSSGCVRLINQDIIDLYNRVSKHNPVVVV
jgi:lipoprotein-anchoring transpeptidase ErfK/SrfK